MKLVSMQVYILYRAQNSHLYYAHVKDWCLNLTVLLEYIHLNQNFIWSRRVYLKFNTLPVVQWLLIFNHILSQTVPIMLALCLMLF